MPLLPRLPAVTSTPGPLISLSPAVQHSDYVYNWTTLDGSGVIPLNEDQTGLTDGTYSVTVKDDHLCTKIN